MELEKAFSLILASCLPAGRRSEAFASFILKYTLSEYQQKKVKVRIYLEFMIFEYVWVRKIQNRQFELQAGNWIISRTAGQLKNASLLQ
jgi:hypothetical protein